jgi:hypothetical protein
MFAMELGARGGSGDETVAIPTTMELDSIKPPRAVEKPEPDSTAQTELGTQCRELGSKVPNSKRDGNSASREVGALLYLTHTNSDRHPHLDETRLSPHSRAQRFERRRV